MSIGVANANGILRFNRGRDCPVCGGSDDDPRSSGRRCHGFLSSDQSAVFCSREEYAGRAAYDSGSASYVHKAKGECPCGREHAPAEVARGPRPKRQFDRSYSYIDADGKVRHTTIRFKNPKSFSQCHPGPDGKDVWNLQGVEPILYRLPEILATAPRAVWIVEGEKDAESLGRIGLVATCNPMGAGKWRDHYSDTLRGRHTIIIPDNDQPGREYAYQVAQSLQGKAASVRIVELPGLPEKGDASDWLASGGSGS